MAGQFYPGDAAALRAAVEECVAGATGDGSVAKAYVAPHAGYIYSGPIAGSAYAAIAPRRSEVRRVLLAGPAHRVPLDGVGVPSVDAFETPLGPVVIDAEARAAALGVAGVSVDDAAHAPEHSLEVHLPFLQVVLEDFTVLPMVVGRGGAGVLATVLSLLWGGPETLVIVSTDLSHYLEDRVARARDRRTAEAIVAGRPADIGPYDACGAEPVRGLLAVTAALGLAGKLLDLRTSADTAGSPDRVVGYGAFAWS